jgi:hypothetical protein
VQSGVGLAVAARPQPPGEQPTRLVAADRTAPLARHVAVPGVYLDGGPVGADAEFHDPVRGARTVTSAAFLLGLSAPQVRDLAVDAFHPQGVPDAQRLQALQVGRQVLEHTFDSMSMIQPRHPSRVRFAVR